MRRGEIAVSTIIVIALGLLVLLILAVLLGQSFTQIDDQTSNCQDTYRGACTTRTACVQQGGQVISGVGCFDDLTHEHQGGWQSITFPAGGAVCCVT